MMEVTVTEDFDFAEWLLDEMEAIGITTKQLAKQSGMTAEGIRNILYENRRPRFDTLFVITRALGKKVVIVDRTEG